MAIPPIVPGVGLGDGSRRIGRGRLGVVAPTDGAGQRDQAAQAHPRRLAIDPAAVEVATQGVEGHVDGPGDLVVRTPSSIRIIGRAGIEGGLHRGAHLGQLRAVDRVLTGCHRFEVVRHTRSTPPPGGSFTTAAG
jgi:hypothetical protein